MLAPGGRLRPPQGTEARTVRTVPGRRWAASLHQEHARRRATVVRAAQRLARPRD